MSGETWPRLGHVALTGAAEKVGNDTFLSTDEPGVYVLASDASIVREKPMPPIVRAEAPTGRRTWIDVSVSNGTLVAFEGDRPVYATLISPGRGGFRSAASIR